MGRDSSSFVMVYRVRPPQIALSVLALSGMLHWLFPEPRIENLVVRFAGAAMAFVGFGIMLQGVQLFKRKDNPIRPQETRMLITEGPYRYSRNPMYLGIVMCLSGIALSIGSLAAWFSPVVFFVFMNVVYIPFEEKNLAALFGGAYDAYCARVRRWI